MRQAANILKSYNYNVLYFTKRGETWNAIVDQDLNETSIKSFRP